MSNKLDNNISAMGPGINTQRKALKGKPANSLKVIFRLWGYLKEQWHLMLVVLLLLLISSGATITASYLLRPIINDYILPHNIPGLIKMTTILLLVYIIGAVSALWQNRLMIMVAQRTVSSLRNNLFVKMQTLPVSFFDTENHGELMSRFTNDMDTVSDSLNTSITQFITSILTLIGVFVMMLYISPMLTLVTVVMVPVMLWIAAQIVKKSKTYFSLQQNAVGTMNGYAEEMITGLKTVKVFGHEEEAEKYFNSLSDSLQDKASKAQLYSGMMMPIMQNLNTINFALTAAVGGALAVLKGLDIGGLAAFLQYSRQFGRPVNEISSQYNSLQVALAGAERIFAILDEAGETPDASNAVVLNNVKGDVQLTDVTFYYNKEKIILKNISLHAEPGKKIALVGTTGAGKTTIMNLLPRFYDIQSGKITIDGVDIRKMKRNFLRKLLAVVLQDTHLFTGTVMENIRYGRLDASDEDVIKAARLTGADSFIDRLPASYQTVLENDGNNLSQGQRQLLNITRAAIAQPVILIFDEATSSIDTRTEKIIQQGIDQLMRGRTSFIIAHRLSTIENADEILVLDNGEIIERGNHDFLLKKNGRYYELYKTQFD